MLLTIICIVIPFVLMWLWFAIKATKDPDVIEASSIRMNVIEYKKYKQIVHEADKAFRDEYLGRRPRVDFEKEFEPRIKDMGKYWKVKAIYDQKVREESHNRMMSSLDEVKRMTKGNPPTNS